nr:M50 family metallopeptidase [Flammeovirgaceae bacterium]
GSNADGGGLIKDDMIIAVNDQPVSYFHEFAAALNLNKSKEVSMTIKRNGEEKELNVLVDKTGKVGFYPAYLLTPSIKHYSLSESAKLGTIEAFAVITVQLKAFNKIFQGDVSASDSLSGPIGIAKIFGGTWDWVKFWTITGMLSMVLAFMNLLPIPALDGGHVVFLSYEIISGRPPSDKFLEASQKVGMVLLLCLMVFAFGNDIYKLF